MGRMLYFTIAPPFFTALPSTFTISSFVFSRSTHTLPILYPYSTHTLPILKSKLRSSLKAA